MCGSTVRQSGGMVSASHRKIKSIMNTLQKGRAYPLTETRTLKTKRDSFGQKYEFESTWLQPWLDDTVRVLGLDQDGVWCRKQYKLKKLPKWLKRGIRQIGEVQTQTQ